jgi:hypothetical protein
MLFEWYLQKKVVAVEKMKDRHHPIPTWTGA